MTAGMYKRYNIRNELAGRTAVTFFGFFLILLTACIVLFIATKGLALFFKDGMSPLEFLFSPVWKPYADQGTARPAAGALIFILGSVSVSLLALALSTPFSTATAIFMSDISPKLGARMIQPAIEIFVGIPSVVYGWVGLTVLVPAIRGVLGGLGFSLLAGGMVLAVMTFPTITSISADALRALPGDYREASLALGATRWQTIRKVLLPAALPGMLTGVVLGLSRAFGEALAVQMVIGNSIRAVGSLLQPTTTMTGIITMDMGNTAMGSMENDALWSMALLLLCISFVFIMVIRKIGAKGYARK